MIDILEEIIQGSITENEANNIFDEIASNFHRGKIKGELHEALGCDVFEWTAILYPISFSVLASWRETGWPQNCGECGSKINHREGGWMIKNNKLKCLKC